MDKGDTRSQISKGTMRTNTRSRKSRTDAEDFENMGVEEVEGLICQVQEHIKMKNKEKKELNKNLKFNKLANTKEQKPIDDELKRLRMRQIMLLQIKDTKIPFWEKLPKDS